jgi:1,4-dihydroxy-2-naphthoate octaprenyltransferase
MKIWIFAARIKTLASSFFPTLAGILLAYRHGYLDFKIAAITLSCSLALQVLANYANDYYDFVKGSDTLDRIGPTRVTSAGLVTPSEMKQAIVLVTAFCFLSGMYLVRVGGFPILAIGILSIIFAIGYTAGPFPLAYLGLGDIFAFTFFGPVATFGSYYLQTQNFSWQPLPLGSLFGFLSVCLLDANNIRDYEEDKLNNKKTIVVRFGEAFGKKVYIGSMFLSLALIPIFCFLGILPWLSALVLVLIPLAKRNILFCKNHSRKEIVPLLAMTAQFKVLYGLILSCTLIL